MEFLTQDEYFSTVKEFNERSKEHWSTATNNRWDYFGRVVNLVKELNLKDPSQILEMGTMGITCVKNTHTIDYAEKWDFPGKNPTYLHDARQMPWPIENKGYDLFIALRVYQHLAPMQEVCFQEAMRIAKKVIIVVPSSYQLPDMFPESKGITYSDFVSYLKGIHPNLYTPTLVGNLYYWDTENPSTFNLEGIMEPQIEHEHLQQPQKNHKSLFTRAKKKLKRVIGKK